MQKIVLLQNALKLEDDLMTQFQIKGRRLMRRRDNFGVSGKRYK